MADLPRTSDYLIALGSNLRHGRYGSPEGVLRAALALLAPLASAPLMRSAPVGPSHRRYANTAALLRTAETPMQLLARLKGIERQFGRRRGGQRWRARVLDLDIVLWSGGCWASDDLIVPHIAFRTRNFVLGPALLLVPHWRDPVSGLTVRQLHSRLTRAGHLPKRG
jgi:2-amino-4-hydroxy-6-hydroxymethyldihydropteridine diphosphokinase